VLLAQVLACQQTATMNPTCGDRVVNQASEECDGQDLAGQSCVDFGFFGGGLNCLASCRVDLTYCTRCGNGVLDEGEECEVGDLQGATCQAEGHPYGEVTCESCHLDTTACRDEIVCGDGFADGAERCDDGNDEPWDGCVDCGVVEFRIPETHYDNQVLPRLACLADDTIVALWRHYDYSLIARWLSPDGTLSEPRALVGDMYIIRRSSLVANGLGELAVVWVTDVEGSSGNYRLWAQRFSEDGVPTSEPTRVDTEGVEMGTQPVAALSDDGDLFVAWTHELGYEKDIRARSLDLENVPRGEPFQVNTFVDGSQSDPAVAVDGSGEVIVVWASNTNETLFHEHNGIWARRYTSAGSALGDELAIDATDDVCTHGAPDVARHPDGDFVVTWPFRGDGETRSVLRARLFTTDTPDGGPVLTVSDILGSDRSVSVAMDSARRWTVVWQHGDDDGALVVRARRFYRNGTALGASFRLPVFPGETGAPDVVHTSDLGFMTAWESVAQDPEDSANESGVYGQRFTADGTPLGLTSAY
jgi:hypothetical protein